MQKRVAEGKTTIARQREGEVIEPRQRLVRPNSVEGFVRLDWLVADLVKKLKDEGMLVVRERGKARIIVPKDRHADTKR